MLVTRWCIERKLSLANNHIILPLWLQEPLQENLGSVCFHFGTWKKEVCIHYSDEVSPRTIGLPCHFENDQFILPDRLEYDLIVEGANLYLGPVLSIIVSPETKMISAEVLDQNGNYLINYHDIRGLVYICALDGMNTVQKTVLGYYFNPHAATLKERWIKGFFPYPNAGYRRIKLRLNKAYDDLLVHCNRRMFNSYCFSKWNLWEMFRGDPLLSQHIPATRRLVERQDLKKMLDKYGSVYVKPDYGSMGGGIRRITSSRMGGYTINEENKKKFVRTKEQLSHYVQKLVKHKNYLIQQSLKVSYRHKPIDFRVIMQKDRTKEWICSGIIARYGEKNHVCTNRVSSLSKGRDALQLVYGLNETQAEVMEAEITRICVHACKRMDEKYKYFGDAGIDVILDLNQKVWILEMNSVQQHKMAAYVDEGMYAQVMANPLEYAKALAGFVGEPTS